MANFSVPLVAGLFCLAALADVATHVKSSSAEGPLIGPFPKFSRPPASQKNYIIHRGKKTSDFPLTGVLDLGTNACTATALPEKPCVILTAKHCPIKSGSTFNVGAEKYGVTSMILLPEPSPGVNFALLERSVKAPADYKFEISKSPANLAMNESVEIVGAGLSGSHAADLADHVQSAEMLFSRGDATRATLYLKPDPKKFATGDWGSLCPGDSGGPVFSKDRKTLLGINSNTELMIPPRDHYCVSKTMDAERLKSIPPCPIGKLSTVTVADTKVRPPLHQLCYDRESGLTFAKPDYTLEPIFGALALASEKGATLEGFTVARSFCELLNGNPTMEKRMVGFIQKYIKSSFNGTDTVSVGRGQPGEASPYLDKESAKIAGEVWADYQKWAKDLKGMQLPSSDDRKALTRRKEMGEFLQVGLPTNTWLSDKAPAGMGMVYMSQVLGAVALPPNPTLCDLTHGAQIVSLGDIWKSRKIDAILKRITCE